MKLVDKSTDMPAKAARKPPEPQLAKKAARFHIKYEKLQKKGDPDAVELRQIKVQYREI